MATPSQNPQVYKFDKDGNYLRFRGITIVSHLDLETCTSEWEDVYNTITRSSLSFYYSPLPVSSYHMTLIDLWCDVFVCFQENKRTKSWKEFLQEMEPRTTETPQLVSSLTTPEPEASIVRATSTLSFPLKLQDTSPINSLRTQLRGQNDTYPYHLTLGYRYKPLPTEGTPEHIQFSNDVLALQNLIVKLSFQLKEPKLCWFPDMTTFNAWDGLVSSLPLSFLND